MNPSRQQLTNHEGFTAAQTWKGRSLLLKGDRTTEQQSPQSYSIPKSGLLSIVPPSWVPYLELTRIEKPTGIYLFYFPHLFGTLLASQLQNDEAKDHSLLKSNVILFGGTIFMRAAACSWNDNMDREYDRQVVRCRFRPLARGAITPVQGHIVTVATTLGALWFLSQLPYPCFLISVPSVALLTLYPFAKRFTDYPQLILGFQVSIGIILGMAAYGLDFSHISTSDTVATTALYLSNICWTVVYDTVYAQQDVEDDSKAGVRSMAVRFRKSARLLLTIVALLQIVLMGICGYLAGFGIGYYILTCFGTAMIMAYMLLTINLQEPAECLWWFKYGCWFVGLSVALGLAYA